MKNEAIKHGHVSTPVLKAIKKNCIECSGGSFAEVKECTVYKCHMWPFRLGKNPWRKEMSQEQKDKAGLRFKKIREDDVNK
tara:strand:- start:15360 stop:15602 length:243 start_codon:yes stop_codon:yes gene_type:complete